MPYMLSMLDYTCLGYTIVKFGLNPLNSFILSLLLSVSLYHHIYYELYFDTSSTLIPFYKTIFSQNGWFDIKLLLCSRNILD